MSVKVKIVGGGIVGLSTASILSRYMESSSEEYNIEVIEKNETVGGGSTKAAGCGLRTLYSHPPNVELARKGIQFWRNADQILPEGIGYRENGYLFLSSSSDRRDQFNRLSTKQESYGIPAEYGSPPNEILTGPDINYENYTASLYAPRSALADPTRMINSLQKDCSNRGIRIRTNSEVQDIRNASGSEFFDTVSTSTSSAEICVDGEWENTDFVVNATGAWSGQIASMVNTDLPIWTARRRLSRLNLNMPSDSPLIVDVDTGVYLLPDEYGVVRAGGNLESNDRYNAENPEAFSTSVSEEWNREFKKSAKILWNDLSEAKVKESWTGLYTMTDSRVPVIDRDGRVIHTTGFSGHGIMQAPGAGMLVARMLSGDDLQRDMIAALSADRENMEPDIQF